MRRILEFNHTEAKRFFLKEESYCSIDMPKYFTFDMLLQQISNYLANRNLSGFYSNYQDAKGKLKTNYPCDFENVNYKFLNNKDGKYAWRPLQIIHPALYISLVNKITEKASWTLIVSRFTDFANNPNIKCYSIPLESQDDQSYKATTVTNWWQSIEQQSMELALLYEYVLHTDISNCYGSIYTHSIPWAIHTKVVAKSDRDENSLVGNTIDKHLRDMAYGQTNGIPQGSVLMDFIAELVLGYADSELSQRIQQENIQDYHIIRYRDDYRIYSNNPQTVEYIAKLLTEVLIDLGMQLNTQKTLVSNNIVRDSIKPDKLYWISSKQGARSIQGHLLLIHGLSANFPNSGSLNKALNKFFDRIKGLTEIKHNIKVLISVLVDIMYKNPRVYPISSAILSKLFSLLNSTEEINNLLQLICNKFEKIPNTGHVKIWLQRLTIKIDRTKIYDENLCKKVNDPNIQIWNSNWLNNALKTIIESTPIINEQVIQGINIVIDKEEVQLFKVDYD
jgi:hypothetical protein